MRLSTAAIKRLGTFALLLSPEGKWGHLKGIDAKGPNRTRQKKEATSPKGGEITPDYEFKSSAKGGKITPDYECTIDRFTGGQYYYDGGCDGMTFEFSITCNKEDGGCLFTEVSQDDSCGFNSYTFDPKHYIREDEESGDCIIGLPFLPLQPRDENESCAKSNLSIQFVAEKGVGPALEMDIYFSDDYGWKSKRGPYKAYHMESERVRKLKLQSDKLPLVAFHEDSKRMLELEGTCQPTMTPYFTIFVTSKSWNGNLGGTLGAHLKCRDLAIEAGLDGGFGAWISDGSSSPAQTALTLFIPNRPYYLVDGTTKVADDWDHLTNALSNELYHPIDKDENGQTVTDALRTWTNTNWNGHPASEDNCDGWLTSKRSKNGKYGWIESTTHNWSWAGKQPCHWEARLYCIQMV